MLTLTSKIQYKDFEPGEFIEEKQRSYEETINLIENFPWVQQRDKTVIDLTNPSVTIENKNNEFLKFALFFNNKYVLHFFDAQQKLFTKSFEHFTDAYPFIKSFYTSDTFETIDFKTENTWMQHNLKHFVSQDFHYTVTPKSAKRYLLKTSWISFALSVFIIAMVVSLGTKLPFALFVFFVVICFFAGGGLNLILFFNYYWYTKDKTLIMSRGNDVFYYGDSRMPVEYDKKNIILVTTYETKWKSPIHLLVLVKIEFKNTSSIYIPNIFVNEIEINGKLFHCPHKSKNSFPYIKKAWQ